MIRSIGAWVVHPFLLAVYPILALFAQNAREVRAGELASLLLYAILGVTATWLLFGLLLRDIRKSGLVTSLAVLLFFTFGRVREPANQIAVLLSKLWVTVTVLDLDTVSIVIPEVVFLGAFASMIAVWLKDSRKATGFLNVFAILLAAMPVFQILWVKAPAAAPPQPRQPVPFVLGSQPAGQGRPDIYYIILDGYARSDVMKSLFDYDNSGFLSRLESKGFYVTRRSTANYCQTPLSLSSSLNASYLDELVKGLGNDQTELSDLIGNNDVVASLRPLGYKFVTFSTGFDPTEHPEADVYLSPHPYINGFERMLIEMTPLDRIWIPHRWRDQYTMARQRILYLLDHLPDVARDPAPTFTLAHILCPHLPFIFGENGEDVALRNVGFTLVGNDRVMGRFRDPEAFCRAYWGQAAFITQRVEQTIDRLLAESPRPPIIILQSDHGSELYLDPQDVQHSDVHERMSILNAYYFPDQNYGGLYQEISPVNSFRVVLNTFFGAELDLLPDKNYFSTWADPYAFIDVTASVRSLESKGVQVQSESNPPDS
ncbi:MAG: hypothetical protein ACLQGP_33715 [Isosphaeraceae bacterium]